MEKTIRIGLIIAILHSISNPISNALELNTPDKNRNDIIFQLYIGCDIISRQLLLVKTILLYNHAIILDIIVFFSFAYMFIDSLNLYILLHIWKLFKRSIPKTNLIYSIFIIYASISYRWMLLRLYMDLTTGWVNYIYPSFD